MECWILATTVHRNDNVMFYPLLRSTKTLGVGTRASDSMHGCFIASAFNQDIGSWNTEKVTDYATDVFFRFCVQPRHWELEHRASD